ncbi:MAG: GTPase domain-containing protein [Bauldia sp.]
MPIEAPPDPEGPAADVIPVVWLIGKVQAGKTSIVRALTGSADAEIGSGFRPCTKTARIFDFPLGAPVIRFLDTRGLGEIAYDPAEDMRYCEGRAHLILVVAKVMDADQSPVTAAVVAVRERHPSWPIVVAQTSLHEGYRSGERHRVPYPSSGKHGDVSGFPGSIADAALSQQRSLTAIPGVAISAFVPIDFTLESDALDPKDYGREALVGALIQAAPDALRVALAALPTDDAGSAAHILRFAIAAGASDAIPAAGAVGVPMIQAAMLLLLARRRGLEWTARLAGEFAVAVGVGTLLRLGVAFGLRQVVKFVPGVGQTVGAAAAATASFGTTYAVGKAAELFLARRERGLAAGEVAAAYRRALAEAFRLRTEQASEG